MAKLKNVGVQDFQDHATIYLSGSDPVAVSRHGQVIGFYIPVERDQERFSAPSKSLEVLSIASLRRRVRQKRSWRNSSTCVSRFLNDRCG